MPNEPQDNLRTLHRNLLREGYQIPVDYNKFQVDMRDEGNLKSLWTNLKSEQYDLPEFDKFKKDMGHQENMPPLIKGSVEEYALGDLFKKSKNDASEAIDRSIDLYNRAYNLNPNSPQSKSKRKQYEEGLVSGDYTVTTGPSGRLKLARKANAGEAYINTLKNSTNSYKESKILKDMSDDSAIKYIEDKFSKEEVMPFVTEGILPKITEDIGGLVRLVAKQGTGALIAEGAAGLLAPETGGLSLAALAAMGGIVGAGDELSAQEYGSNLMKYYMQGKAEGLNPKDAIQKARTQASRASNIGYAEAIGYELAGKAAGRLFPKEVTGKGVKAAVGKYLTHAAPEVLGAATVAGGSSVAKDMSAKELGYKVSNKEMFDNAWNEASDIGKFMLATTALHGAANGIVKVPNYVKSQLKNYVTSIEDGLGEKVLNNLKDAGVLKAADVEKTIGSLKDFKKASKDIEPLNVEDEHIKGALAGKQERKNKLKSEIEELKNNDVPIGIDAKQSEIDKLNKEMQAIHETGDVDKHEHDQDFGYNVRIEGDGSNRKLFVDDVEVTPEEFEYVIGKKPEDYPSETIEEAKPTEEISVYHGGSIKDLTSSEGGLFVSADKNQAEYYAKGNKGQVQEFKLNKNDISNENNVREIINELGLKSKEEGWDLNDLMLHEIIDPRFETSLSEGDLKRLYNELDKRGYKAIEMLATDVSGKQKNVNDILILNPKETLKTKEQPTAKSSVKKRKKISEDVGIKLKSIDESKIQPIPEGYFDTPEKQDLLNKFKDNTITDEEVNRAVEIFSNDEFVYIDKNFMQFDEEFENDIAQIMPQIIANEYKDVKRGTEEIKSTIENGVKEGKISEQSAKIASTLLDKRPDLFSELGLLLKSDEESFGTLGSYDPVNQAIEIFQVNEDSTTIAHELLHHTEKFLPIDIKLAIREEWISSIEKEIKSLNKDIKKVNLSDKELKKAEKALEYLINIKETDGMYQNIDTMDLKKYLKQRDGLYNYFRGEDALSKKYYYLFDSSEWWANNGAEMLKKYSTEKGKKEFIDKIKDFYKELIEAIKQFVNPTKAKEVENALNNLLSGAYTELEGNNIAGVISTRIRKNIGEEKYTQTEEGKKVDEEAKKMGYDGVDHAINSVNEALGTDYKKFQQIKPEEFKETEDIRNHNKAYEETVKGTEYEIKERDTEPSGKTATGTTGEVSGKPEEKTKYSHESAGFKDESEARDAYEQRGNKDVNETYEEFIRRKICGDF